MSSQRLAEYAYDMILDLIKTEIPGALLDVRTDRVDAKISTEIPKSYFKYQKAQSYQTPAIFIIIRHIKLQNVENGANFIAAQSDIGVSVLVEDRTLDNLVLKAWRYQAALHKILHETSLTSSDTTVKLVIKVDDILFSPEFSKSDNPNVPDGVFRKEVLLNLEVEHWENL